jgi:hypothetical protein
MESIFTSMTNTKLFIELIKSLPNHIKFDFKTFGNDCIGYNNMSGNVWIALENNIVAANDGDNVKFITRDFETGEECEYDSYEEALIQEKNTNQCKYCSEICHKIVCLKCQNVGGTEDEDSEDDGIMCYYSKTTGGWKPVA